MRVLAVEQLAALPFATQLLARLGAEVVKIEHPSRGESGRASTPGVTDPEGRHVGATFLRNSLNKSSVGIDLKLAEGVDLFLDLAPQFDIVAENFKAGTADRLGIGYDAVQNVHPEVIYEYKRRSGRPPAANPVGALGDISSALFAVIGIPDETSSAVGIVDTFEAGGGHFVLQVVREHRFERLAETVGHPEWLTDDHLESRSGWQEHFDTVIRSGVEVGATSMTSSEAVAELAAEGIAAGESQTREQNVNDRHVAARHMLVELPRPNGDGPPVLVPGNPIKMSRMADGLDPDRLAGLRARGVIG